MIKVEGLVQFAAGWTHRDSPEVDDRPFLSVHRARLFLRGKPHSRINYLVHFAFDRIGADEFALLQGKPLSASRGVVIQDALAQFAVLDQRRITLSGGFFRPTVGRESNSAVPAMPNHEPALTSTLVRRLTTDTGHGRASGVNLGGRLPLSSLRIVYNLGLFAPVKSGSFSNENGMTETEYARSQGARSAPLVTGNLILTDETLSQFRANDLLFVANPFSKTMGWMAGASASHRDRTDEHESTFVQTYFAQIYGAGFYLDGEFAHAARDAKAPDGMINQGTNYAWHARGGYNIPLGHTVLTPFILYSELVSDDFDESSFDTELKAHRLYAGTTTVLDAGINWHLRKHRIRFGAHFLRTAHEPTTSGASRAAAFEGWSSFLTCQVAN